MFDRAASSLPSLPGAEREARGSAQRYSRRRLLIGRDATRRTFLEQVKSANVVHFAGHAVVSLDAPMYSQPMLAPDAEETNPGRGTRWICSRCRSPRLASPIPLGCQTAGGGLSATEGVSSLARSLMAAGVPAVIASLWAVDDEATATFFAAYHDDFSRSGQANGSVTPHADRLDQARRCMANPPDVGGVSDVRNGGHAWVRVLPESRAIGRQIEKRLKRDGEAPSRLLTSPVREGPSALRWSVFALPLLRRCD